jgi:hypothetical protein
LLAVLLTLPVGQAEQEPGLPYPVVIVLVALFTQPQVFDGLIVVPVRLVALRATVLILSWS